MTNIGSLDRILRFLLGAALTLSPFLFAGSVAGMGAWRVALVAVGALLIGTALFRVCPAYVLFGIRTCPGSRS